MNMQGINCTKKAYSKFYFAKVHEEYRQGNFIDVKN